MKSKNKKIMLALVVAGLMTGVLAFGTRGNEAEGISAICAQSDECRAAAEKEAEANQKKSEAMSTANEYQNKVNELSAAVKDQQAKIEKSENRIDELKEEIVKTKDDLKKKQEALAEMLVNLHFENDKEPIRILAGSNSISDLAEKASREDTARQQIGTAAESVRETKEKLESDKAEIENLLAEQQSAKKELVSKRKEQQDFVNKYKDDAESYAEVARQAREEQQKAILAYQQAHQSDFMGGFYAGTGDSYGPNLAGYLGFSSNPCPAYQDAYNDDIGYPICECTSYAAFKAREFYGAGLNIGYLGDAKFWGSTAAARGYLVDQNPAPYTVGVSTDGPYGHVFWVEAVNSDGTISISEYNNYYTSVSGSSGDYGTRTMSPYGNSFIHF